MPSFDIVSEVDLHEVSNAVDQTNREVGTRFDFKGTNARVEQNEAPLPCMAKMNSRFGRCSTSCTSHVQTRH